MSEMQSHYNEVLNEPRGDKSQFFKFHAEWLFMDFYKAMSCVEKSIFMVFCVVAQKHTFGNKYEEGKNAGFTFTMDDMIKFQHPCAQSVFKRAIATFIRVGLIYKIGSEPRYHRNLYVLSKEYLNYRLGEEEREVNDERTAKLEKRLQKDGRRLMKSQKYNPQSNRIANKVIVPDDTKRVNAKVVSSPVSIQENAIPAVAPYNPNPDDKKLILFLEVLQRLTENPYELRVFEKVKAYDDLDYLFETRNLPDSVCALKELLDADTEYAVDELTKAIPIAVRAREERKQTEVTEKFGNFNATSFIISRRK